MKKYYMAVETGCTSYHLLLNNYLPGNFRLLLLHSLSGRRASGSSRSCCFQYLAVFLTVEREKNCVLSSNALATFRELVLSDKLDQPQSLLGILHWAKERSRERAIMGCFFTKLFICSWSSTAAFTLWICHCLVNWLIYTISMPCRLCSLSFQGGIWLEQMTAHF